MGSTHGHRNPAKKRILSNGLCRMSGFFLLYAKALFSDAILYHAHFVLCDNSNIPNPIPSEENAAGKPEPAAPQHGE